MAPLGHQQLREGHISARFPFAADTALAEPIFSRISSGLVWR
jgi:hypothetical protein